MAPQVQNLSDIVASLNSTYDPQRAAVTQQIGTAQQNGQNAVAGLNAAKDQAFNNITQTANDRGMLFSGFTPDQQAKYTASTFLPAMVNLNAKTQDNINKLQQTILGLNTAQNQQANGIQQGQIKNLNDYNINSQKLAQEMAIAQMNNDARLKAASISASRQSAPSTSQIMANDAAALHQKFAQSGLIGNDGYISPQTYAQGLNIWQQAGHDQKSYDSLFSGLRNPHNHNTDYKLATGWGS